jgi:hypothetical protein
MGFATTARATEADGSGTVGAIAQARGGAGEQLAGLQGDADAGEVFELIGGTAGINRRFDVVFEFDHRGSEKHFNHGWTPMVRIHGCKKTRGRKDFDHGWTRRSVGVME